MSLPLPCFSPHRGGGGKGYIRAWDYTMSKIILVPQPVAFQTLLIVTWREKWPPSAAVITSRVISMLVHVWVVCWVQDSSSGVPFGNCKREWGDWVLSGRCGSVVCALVIQLQILGSIPDRSRLFSFSLHSFSLYCAPVNILLFGASMPSFCSLWTFLYIHIHCVFTMRGANATGHGTTRKHKAGSQFTV